MPSSSKENVPSTTSSALRSAAMNDDDVFGSSAPSEMMLSPPPEEELRYSRRPINEPSSASRPLANSMRPNHQSPTAYQTSKRKRTVAGVGAVGSPGAPQNQLESSNGLQHTPNPRVRKQVRHTIASPKQATATVYADAPLGSPSRGGGPLRTNNVHEDVPATPTRKGKSRGRSTELVSQSPYASNPNADYIPPSRLAASPRGVTVRRRSVTPIPPYEPPKERYTPPREVVVSPPAPERKPTRRTTAKKKRVSVKTEKQPVQLWVKTEPPEIDLTTPAPPASPGDDPILLVGPPSIRVQRASVPPGDSRDVSLVDFQMDLDLPGNKGRPASRPTDQANASETQARSSSIPAAFDFSNLNNDDGGIVDNGFADSSSEVDFGTVIDDGNFASVNGDGWSDSDSDNGNGNGEGTSIGEGDFTGKFMMFKAPLKLDPPTDDAGDRMEKWARPISPHPKRLSLVEPKEEEEEDADVSLDESSKATGQVSDETHRDNVTTANGDDSVVETQETRQTGYEDRRGRRLTLSEVEAIKFGPSSPTSTPIPASKGRNNHSHEQHARAVDPPLEQHDTLEQEGNSLDQNESIQADTTQQHTILDDSSILNNNLDSSFDLTQDATNDSCCRQNAPAEEIGRFSARSASERSSTESSQSTLNNPDIVSPEYRQHIGNEEATQLLKYGKDAMQEQTMHSAVSLLRTPCPPDSHLSDCETEIATEEDQEDDSEGSAGDLSVVKIVSDDAMAAARAAAILKMHDYDMVARKLRRRKTTAGGVSKAYNSPKNMQLWRRRTVAGLAAEDALSVNISLPDLLEKAEEELRCSPARSRSGSVALSSVGSPQKPRWTDLIYDNADTPGIRDWTKAAWKLLDSCFTDERYDLSEQMGLEAGCLADVDDVPLECVVQRFVEIMGSTEMVESHGPAWTTEKLMSRAKALCKRQRAGNGAPPTPDVSARFSTPSRFSTLSPTSRSMIVPDFTPSTLERTRLFDYGSVSRKARLPPPSSDSFFKMPSTLPARHSRLREDVTSEVLETPKPSRALDLFGFPTPARNQQSQQDDSDDESIAHEVDAMLTPITASRVRQSRPESAVKRSLSYISSWLKPDMYKSKKKERKGAQLPGLPVPPSDVLAKPRGPIETPAAKPAPKPVPPKELVSLEHVPPPQPTRIPRRQRPRRLVDLNHVPPPVPKEEVKTISRRSSASSVKDLIKEFEEKEKGKVKALPPRVAELRRQASVGSLKAKAKATWRP